jgi:hypothetical protein
MTFRLLPGALIASLVVVGRRLVQSIVARRAIAAVVCRLLGKLSGIWIRCGHLLEKIIKPSQQSQQIFSRGVNLQSKFELEIVEIHLASHLSRRSTHKEEYSSAAGWSQSAVTAQGWSCCRCG